MTSMLGSVAPATSFENRFPNGKLHRWVALIGLGIVLGIKKRDPCTSLDTDSCRLCRLRQRMTDLLIGDLHAMCVDRGDLFPIGENVTYPDHTIS